MPDDKKRKGSELLIVDNSDSKWKVRDYLKEWAELANKFDIATGYFEIGALLALDGHWQKIDQIRILMGDEVSKRTKRAITQNAESKKQILDDSIESEKETNDFLEGVPAIADAIKSKKIKCRVYTKDKFHAKAYITHSKHEVMGATALVGSSNFTYPGLTDNVELNVQLRTKVEELQDWFERHWKDAEELTPDILKVIERHTREFKPFEVYAKSLYEFFKGHEMTASEWEMAPPEKGGSRVYKILDQYQREGYQAIMKIAHNYHGAFLCDGVGLGKTFIGLMIIERLIMHDRKRVALFVPKTARYDVWEREIKKYLPHVGGTGRGVFSNLIIFNHTDLNRGGEFPENFQRVKEMADAIVIDEAHHFRNPGIKGTGERKPSRYRILDELIDGPSGPKQVFHITATPVNNRIIDFRHMLDLITRQQDNYLKRSRLGIHSIRGHFNKMENALKKQFEGLTPDDVTPETNLAEAEKILTDDGIFQELVVQRSRAYVKQSQIQQGAQLTCFPERKPPKVADYSIKIVYGRLLDMVEKAFEKEKPLFILGIYYPLAYYTGSGDIDPWLENRQKQVVQLVKTMFLKRLESSAHAFERSCDRLLIKLLTWIKKHSESKKEIERLEKWMGINADIIGYVDKRQQELFGINEDEADEDFITEEMLEGIDELSRDEYNVADIINDSYIDLDQVVKFIDELKKFKPRNDSKLARLIKLLKTDEVLRDHKVLIFTEFAETARYLKKQLEEAEIEGVDQIDSMTKGARKGNRTEIIHRFAPYYNGLSSAELAEQGKKEIRVLISTDVLSEGLNLQDATRLINYDLHWNPVRLMQRIGRVDRRLNPDTEKRIIADHPEQAEIRGKIEYWNFLPPEELERLLRLYKRVSGKTLKISRTFGIEGRKLLTPDDEYDALKEFNKSYDGETSSSEKMKLELNRMLKDNPDLEDKLISMPKKIFSGRKYPKKDTKAVFFCYAIPAPDQQKIQQGFTDADAWTTDAGFIEWILYDINTEKFNTNPSDIFKFIRCTPDEPRKCKFEPKTLTQIRKDVEKHIKNKHFKKLQAPIGVKPTLKAWMELN